MESGGEHRAERSAAGSAERHDPGRRRIDLAAVIRFGNRAGRSAVDNQQILERPYVDTGPVEEGHQPTAKPVEPSKIGSLYRGSIAEGS